MALSPAYDKGTRFTNYSSINSADAFVGDYQVMYTPGSTSPQANRGSRKPSRFSKPPSSMRHHNVSQSYLLPSNMPNTSQVLPDHGILPHIQVHYNIPADEKQIVASLRSLQRDLGEAMQTIAELTRERDEAIHELRLLRATSRKAVASARKQNIAARVEEELFDLSRLDEDSPKKFASELPKGKTMAMEKKQITTSDDARVISAAPLDVSAMKQSEMRVASKGAKSVTKPYKSIAAEETEQSIVHEEQTAASNTSRRRRRPSMEDNMTSAYILPDITEEQRQQPLAVSEQAQQVLHSLDPAHVANCEVCHRLTTTTKSRQTQATAKKQVPQATTVAEDLIAPAMAKPDYTRKLAGFHDESFVDNPTVRPKVAPSHALARVRTLMDAQFLRAKARHNEAWLKYDAVEAPLSSRRHAQIGKELNHWAEKMEECRVHLDYLRDVEEGMIEDR